MNSRTPPPRDPAIEDVNPVPPTDAAATTGTTASPPPPPKYLRPGQRSVVLMVLVALVGIALILWAWNLWPFRSAVVATDNAYVRGPVTVLAPQVSGYVK